jgi:hypothetical protein
MNDDLTGKVVAWATQTARQAAELSSREAREAYLTERHRADVCVDAARRIMTELMVQRAGEPRGHG